MEYESKSPGMNKFLNELFPHEEGQCPTCKGPIGPFRDSLSEREYRISHMCQKCQDSVFDKDSGGDWEDVLDDPQDSWPRPGDEYGLDGTDAYDRYRDQRADQIYNPTEEEGEEEYARYESVLEPYGMDYLYDGGGPQWP